MGQGEDLIGRRLEHVLPKRRGQVILGRRFCVLGLGLDGPLNMFSVDVFVVVCLVTGGLMGIL